jgi:hypothetical protein
MKRVIAFFTLVSFIIFNTSCYSYKTLSSQKEYCKYTGNKKVHVLYVQTKQGYKIEFNEKFPGIISEKVVVGLPQLRLPFGGQDSIIFLNKKIGAICKNGINYELITQDKLGYICHSPDTIKIPLSDIGQLHFKKFNTGVTIGLVSGIILTPFFIRAFFIELYSMLN